MKSICSAPRYVMLQKRFPLSPCVERLGIISTPKILSDLLTLSPQCRGFQPLYLLKRIGRTHSSLCFFGNVDRSRQPGTSCAGSVSVLSMRLDQGRR